MSQTNTCLPILIIWSWVFLYFGGNSCFILLFLHLALYRVCIIIDSMFIFEKGRGNSIMVSISVCQVGRPGSSRYDLFVSERWTAAKMLSTCPHQCRRLVHQRPSMYYHVYVIMHVIKSCPISRLLSVPYMVCIHKLNTIFNMIQTNKYSIEGHCDIWYATVCTVLSISKGKSLIWEIKGLEI